MKSTNNHTGQLSPEQVLREAGLIVDSIAWDTPSIVRIPTIDKPRQKDGAYRAYSDAPRSVWFQNFRTGQSETWTEKSKRELSPEERSAIARRLVETRKQREAELNQQHAKAAETARTIYAAAIKCEDHPYLARKGVQTTTALKIYPQSGALIVPAYNDKKEISTLQFISDDGSKKFLPGGRKGGCFFPIGFKIEGGPLLICEGLATGLSLHECTGYAVLVAFDAGNIQPAAVTARQWFPGRDIVIAADNDCETDGNPGISKATAAAEAIKGRIVVPPVNGKAADWNDVHKAQGIEAVRDAFSTVLMDDEPVEIEDTPEKESGFLPTPLAVPLTAFPDEVAGLILEAAEAFQVPLQVPVAVLLAMLSCLIGASRYAAIKKSWPEPGVLWIALIAPSGVGKSPLTSAFMRAVKELEYQAFKDWKAEYADYETKLEQIRKARRSTKDGDFVPCLPEKPIRRQALLDDVTLEGIGEAVSSNPKGIALAVDELSGLILGFDRYTKKEGGTKARLLSSYSGGDWKVTRATPDRNFHASESHISIFGGIQPGLLPKIFQAGADGTDEVNGFLQRFIFIRAEREEPVRWTDTSLSERSISLIERVTEHLWRWDIELDEHGRTIKKIVSVSEDAKGFFVKWFRVISREEFYTQDKGYLAKLRGQALRLCLIFHSLDAALAGSDGMEPISEDCMVRALRVADWIRLHGEQCRRLFSPGRTQTLDPVSRSIMEVVVEEAAKGKGSLKITNTRLVELVRIRPNMGDISSEAVGRHARRLRLAPCWIGRDRGQSADKELISSFQKTVGSVGSVANS